MMMTSDFRPDVEITAVLCMRSASGHNYRNSTVRSLWTWPWGRYHVPQNVWLVNININLICDHSCNGEADMLVTPTCAYVSSLEAGFMILKLLTQYADLSQFAVDYFFW